MPNFSHAFSFLQHTGPSLFRDVRRMLYVGHRNDTAPWWAREFSDALGVTHRAVIDIDGRNLGTAAGLADELFHGDVLTHPIVLAGWDMVFWDEGPEHVPQDRALARLVEMMAHNRNVVVSCPWGFQRQGEGPSDPEFHHWGPDPEDFMGIGMMARAFGTRFMDNGSGHGNVVAWGPI